MADPRRVAAALAYQQGQQDPFDAVPVADAPGTVRAPQTLPMTFMDRLNNLSAGLGTGITNQLEGYRQLITDPIQSAKDIGTAAVTAVRNPSVIVDALKGMGERAASGSQGLGEVLGENITLNPRKLAMALTHPKVAEMTVYHGTPHRFPATEANPLGEFDASKIGTGEGAQAYGHGIYVAESPDVAQEYRNRLSTNVTVDGSKLQSIPSDSPLAEAHNMVVRNIQSGMAPDAAISATRKYWIDAAEEMKAFAKNNPELAERIAKESESRMKVAEAASSLKPQSFYRDPGSLYHVDLPDSMIEKMLDWDKPLSEQPKNVQEAFKSFAPEMYDKAMQSKGFDGETIYKTFGKSKEGSEALRQLDVPGIRYLDAGSRDAATGTRNFVIFPGEEKNLKILERK